MYAFLTNGKWSLNCRNLCDIAIKLFCTLSKIGHAEGFIFKRVFSAWRSNAMAIEISVFESALRAVSREISLKKLLELDEDMGLAD